MVPPMKDTCRLGASILLAAAFVAACSSEAKKAPDTTAVRADSSLNRDLALANQDTAAKPQLKDAPAATPAPAERAAEPEHRRREEPRRAHDVKPSTPAPGAPATTPAERESGRTGTIAAGSTLNLHASDRICTNTNAVGDHVTATVDGSVPGTNGASIPSGAAVHMTVTRLKRAENTGDSVVIAFAVNSVSFGGRTYPLDGAVTSIAIDRIRDEPKSKDAQKVAIGAVAGAIAGKLIGKSTKGAVVGGVVGAGAGAAAAAETANFQGCIPSGGSIVVKLNSAATVKA